VRKGVGGQTKQPFLTKGPRGREIDEGKDACWKMGCREHSAAEWLGGAADSNRQLSLEIVIKRTNQETGFPDYGEKKQPV